MSEQPAPYNAKQRASKLRAINHATHMRSLEPGQRAMIEAAVRRMAKERDDDPRVETYGGIRMLFLNLAPALLTDDELEELRALLGRLVKAGHERRPKR